MINRLALRLTCPADVCLEDVGGWYRVRRVACLQAACVLGASGMTITPSVLSLTPLGFAISLSAGALIINEIAIHDLLSRASSSMLEAQHAMEACLEEFEVALLDVDLVGAESANVTIAERGQT